MTTPTPNSNQSTTSASTEQDTIVNAAVNAAVAQATKDLQAQFATEKTQIEAASKRKPWTVIAYSALAGFIIGLIVEWVIR